MLFVHLIEFIGEYVGMIDWDLSEISIFRMVDLFMLQFESDFYRFTVEEITVLKF